MSLISLKVRNESYNVHIVNQLHMLSIGIDKFLNQVYHCTDRLCHGNLEERNAFLLFR